jgi:hypothetical protein
MLATLRLLQPGADPASSIQMSSSFILHYTLFFILYFVIIMLCNVILHYIIFFYIVPWESRTILCLPFYIKATLKRDRLYFGSSEVVPAGHGKGSSDAI